MSPAASQTATSTTTGLQTSTSVMTTSGNQQTTTVAEVVSDTYEVTIISYDDTLYYISDQPLDDTYLDRDKRKYLGYLYHNGTNRGMLFYVYDYKEQGQPALILLLNNSGEYKLFLP
jgi:hypothetical protein